LVSIFGKKKEGRKEDQSEPSLLFEIYGISCHQVEDGAASPGLDVGEHRTDGGLNVAIIMF